MTSTIDYGRAIAIPPGAAKRFAIQTAAIFVDAYRELNAKKLFWITLILSLLVVIAFAFVGINERGVSIFGKTMPGAWNTSVIPRDTFYKFLFTQLAIPIWLGVAAAILALISVGSVFPDFMSGGSIDLYLSKPIGRLRLFLTKYVAGLMFVALQVLVFSLASFVVIGVRGKTWEPGIFLAVPLVVSFFSYLYCVCVLIGIVTRSALAAILVTLLFWFMLYILNSADTGLLFFKAAQEDRQARLQNVIDFNQRMIDQQKALPATRQSPDMIRNYEFQMKKPTDDKREVDDTVRQLRWWHNLVTRIKAPLPKTAETVALMSRWLVEPDAITKAEREQHAQRRQRREAWRQAHAAASSRPAPPLPPPDGDTDEDDAREELMAELTGRKAVKLIGSSLGFEAVILGIVAWIFCRRDF